MKRRGIWLIIAVFMLSSCATIVSKSDWPVKITSTPNQANVTITDIATGRTVYTGKTPTTVTLYSKGGYLRGKTYRVEVKKEGYTPRLLI
jgi:uncharacterized protein YceK